MVVGALLGVVIMERALSVGKGGNSSHVLPYVVKHSFALDLGISCRISRGPAPLPLSCTNQTRLGVFRVVWPYTLAGCTNPKGLEHLDHRPTLGKKTL